MIRSLFLSMQELNKGARRPPNVPPTKVKKVAVIGAGFMGASVGYVSARAGIDVVLIDRDQESADKGKGHARSVIDDLITKGRAKEAERDAILARITPTADYAALKDCDLVIEAVFEDRKVKAETYAKAQPLPEGRRDLRLQHLDAADQLAGRRASRTRASSSASISSRRSRR